MAEVLNNTKEIIIDKIQVMNFTVAAWPQKGIGVNYAIGYDNAEGVFVPVEPKQIGFEGEDFARIVTSPADGSLTLYENIKLALYTEIAKANNIGS